ncbi:MAG: CHAT domain-containing protein, partial [Synechococcales bacterium]|nr:CHAT domain-containing protein [Synechococcales bacterium]
AQYEAYYQGQLTSQLLELPEIQQRLLQLERSTQRRTALVYVIPSPKFLDIILVPPNQPALHRRIRVSSEQRQSVIRSFRQGVVNPDSLPEDYLPAAQQLHTWMIQPISTALQNQKIDSLIFCLGGGLRSLPIAALHDGQRFLVERFNLAIIPAFNLLDHRTSQLRKGQILALGASEFASETDLPAVPLELQAITDRPWRGKVLLNQAFTLQNFHQARSQAPNHLPYNIIHLATHANISEQSVQQSYIRFWDQPLSLDQMATLGLRQPPVDLLVLSACRTALDSPVAELGFAGLAVKSGAKAAIASLWSVNDTGTFIFMTDFYRRLKQALIKAEALRQTQLSLLRHPMHFQQNRHWRGGQPQLSKLLQSLEKDNLSHPYYWASFTMIGNPW